VNPAAFAVDGFTEKDGGKQGGSPFPEEKAHPDAAPTSRMTPTATKTGSSRFVVNVLP
jgi:hypothetical protein